MTLSGLILAVLTAAFTILAAPHLAGFRTRNSRRHSVLLALRTLRTWLAEAHFNQDWDRIDYLLPYYTNALAYYRSLA